MASIQEEVLKVRRFLAKEMMTSKMTEKEIQDLRERECIEVMVQGNNTEVISIQGLEARFKKQESDRITIPSQDILQWNTKFPLHETCDDFLTELNNLFNALYEEGNSKITENESKIEEELNEMKPREQTAEKIVDMFKDIVILDASVLPDNPVMKKMKNEIADALMEVDRTVQKTRVISVLQSILFDGVEKKVLLTDKKKWGGLNNRRGQIGENRTMAAMSQALDGFMGMTVAGMKTFTYLYKVLEKMNIQLTYQNTVNKTNEVEHDIIATWLEQDTLVVTMIESKIKEYKPWADQTAKAEAAIKHAKFALKQLHKDFVTFKEIFPDIPDTIIGKIRFQYFVSLSDFSCEDWPEESSKGHIIFKEDIENINNLQSKLKLPSIPPDPETISEEVKALNRIIGARYVGGASFISLKTPGEGFMKQSYLLKNIRTGYEKKLEKVFMLGKEQQAVFQSGLCNYSNFGGHGSGKTLLLQGSIKRDAQNILANKESGTNHLQIICVWQKGADALMEEYRQLASTFPVGENLEVMVLTKEELMNKFLANDQVTETTFQINDVCKNISLLEKDREAHLYIDECWITAPRKCDAHLTLENPNEVVGHIPFIRNGVLYPWSKLDPGLVKLSVAVMPDCQHLLGKDLITLPPPQQGPVLTVFSPRSFRTTMRIHSFIQFIQERVEMDLRVWRYLLPPKNEQDGHEIMGTLPVWQSIEKTDHLICQNDQCEQCFLRNILKPLEMHYSDALNKSGAKPEDVVFIVNQDKGARCTDQISAVSFLHTKFPGVDVKFDDKFEGMEKPVVFNLTNGSIGTSPSIIPLSLTRANRHLILFTEDFRNMLKDAADKGLVKKSRYHLSTHPDQNTDSQQPAIGLCEASDTLSKLARQIPLEDIQLLAQEWGVEELYVDLVTQEKTRFQMIKSMSQRHMEENPTLTMAQFMESLNVVNMTESVSHKIAENLNNNIDELKERITAKILLNDQQIALAHSLGQRSMFNSLTQPEEQSIQALSDKDALLQCLDVWVSQSTRETTTEKLLECLLLSGLSGIANEIKEKSDENFETASFQNMSVKDQIKTSVMDVFLPVVTSILTIIYMALLLSNGKHFQLCIFLLLHWIPAAFLYSIHLFLNNNVFGSSVNNTRKVLLIVFQPVSSTALHILYLLKMANYTGQAVERFKMKRILQLTEASTVMSSFTSLGVTIFTLSLANKGIISVEETTVFSFSLAIILFHTLQIFITILKKQNIGDILSEAFLQICLMIPLILSSLLIKIVSIVVLLSCETSYGVLFGFPLFFCLSFATNFGLEKWLLTNRQEVEENRTFLRAVHSLIFPLAPESYSTRHTLGVSLQLSLGNIAAASFAFSVALFVGVGDNMFITQNMIEATFGTLVCLLLYSAVVYYLITTNQRSSDEAQSLDDFEEHFDDTYERLPLLRSTIRHEGMECIKKSVVVLVLLLVMILSIISCFQFLVKCQGFPSNSQSHISCTNEFLTVGTECTLTCSPQHWSSSSLYSTCNWRGLWTESDFTCRRQVAAVIGPTWNSTQRMWTPATDIYPPTGTSFHLPGVPLSSGHATYIDGGILYCGGYNNQDLKAIPLKSCYSLKPPTPKWEKILPLCQETRTSSVAVIEGGRAMWILGGMDGNLNTTLKTQIVRPGMATEYGPDMPEPSLGHCSTTLLDGSVIVTGGRQTPFMANGKTRIYNITTKQWEAKQDMKQSRSDHSCAQIWLSPNDPMSDFINGLVGSTSVLSIVVAGGVNFVGSHPKPRKSVELYLPWNDTWISLPDLPIIHYDKASINISLTNLMPINRPKPANNYLHILGGAEMDWQIGSQMPEPAVLQLIFDSENLSYHWEKDENYEEMDLLMEFFNEAVGIPDNFISSFVVPYKY